MKTIIVPLLLAVFLVGCASEETKLFRLSEELEYKVDARLERLLELKADGEKLVAGNMEFSLETEANLTREGVEHAARIIGKLIREEDEALEEDRVEWEQVVERLREIGIEKIREENRKKGR